MGVSRVLVVWRPDRSEGSHRDAEFLLGFMLATTEPTPHSEEWARQMAHTARLCGDLHDPETGLYLGAVTPSGIDLRSAP